MNPRARMRPNETLPWTDNGSSPRLILEFKGGINENTTPDISECASGYNFDLAYGRTSIVPRLPFDLKGTATNVGNISGFLQLIKRDNTETTLVASGNTVYLWDGGSTFTSKGAITASRLRDCYWSLADVLVISDVDKNNVLMEWDGTTLSNLTTGLASPLKAKYAVSYLNRIWLFNITYNGVEYPHMILVSGFEDYQDYDNTLRGGPTSVGGGSFSTGLEAFYLLVPDLKPINGVSVFANKLIISTDKGAMWSLSGTSGSTFQFDPFMDTNACIGDQAMENIGNDIAFVRPGGSIALMTATQNYGNVVASNIAHWIPDTTKNLVTVNQIVYDILNQRVLFFVPNKVLVFYKDIMSGNDGGIRGLSPWSCYSTNDSCGFNTSAAKYMRRPGTTEYSVYFGDTVGRIFDLYGTGTQDAGGADIVLSRVTRHIGPEILQPWPWMKENITGHIRYHRDWQTSLVLTLLWDDEYSDNASTLTLEGPTAADSSLYFGGANYFGGSNYFNQGFFFLNRVSSLNIEPGGKGPGFTMEIATTASKPFQLDSISFD